MKAIVLSHGHPAFSKGGGEYAAYYLWQGLNRRPGTTAWFIGRAHPEALHQFCSLAVMGERDYIMSGNAIIADLTATTPLGPDSDFAELLRSIDPDVVHFHHYVHLGIELIRVVRNACPRAKIVMTLHEFIALCMNNGQMVKTDGRLCHQYSPRECNLCFRHLKAEDFFLRERYIKSFFNLVDGFISPSAAKVVMPAAFKASAVFGPIPSIIVRSSPVSDATSTLASSAGACRSAAACTPSARAGVRAVSAHSSSAEESRSGRTPSQTKIRPMNARTPGSSQAFRGAR